MSDLYSCSVGNPLVASATEACCGIVPDSDRADRACEYRGERVTYQTNAERCYELGGFPCKFNGLALLNINANKDCIDDYGHSFEAFWENIWHWTVRGFSYVLSIKSRSSNRSVDV